MTEQDALFGAEDFLAPGVEPGVELTAGARLRLRQQALIDQGFHPLSYIDRQLRLLERPPTEGGPTCGTCVFRESRSGGAKSYPKCMRGYSRTPIPEAERVKYGPSFRVRTPYATHSEASDVRAWWPACEGWKAKPDE